MPARVIAGSFALIAFSFALLLGLLAGNDALTIIGRAMVGSGVCYLVGLFVAHVGRRAVLEHVDQYTQSNPIPSLNSHLESSNVDAASEHATATTQDASGEGGTASPAPVAA